MKLLVVTDLEESHEIFFSQARNWAARFADQIWLVHVEDPDPAFIGYGTGPQEVRDTVAEEIREHHRRLEEESNRWREQGLDVTALVVQGPIVETILEQAAKVGADAIMMGAPSHSRWHDLLLGNIADSLIRRARIPVLVIPSRGEE